MNKIELIEQIRIKKSLLCVGLDSDIEKLPIGIPKTLDGLLEFNKIIIDATKEYAISYKINTAFYEQYGSEGWKTMEASLEHIPNNCFSIADAKRGDIGNTSKMYAKAFFKHMNFDSVTVAPYMGEDSLSPFFEFDGKWVICLGLTSNKGSKDFQTIQSGGSSIYEIVMEKVSQWGNPNNLMFVTGATKSSDLKAIRQNYPEHFFLVPGVGAQGGTVEEVCDNALNDFGGLIINSSRGIIYASDKNDFAEKANEAAKAMQMSCQNAMKL